jgi:hypothetical protein
MNALRAYEEVIDFIASTDPAKVIAFVLQKPLNSASLTSSIERRRLGFRLRKKPNWIATWSWST